MVTQTFSTAIDDEITRIFGSRAGKRLLEQADQEKVAELAALRQRMVAEATSANQAHSDRLADTEAKRRPLAAKRDELVKQIAALDAKIAEVAGDDHQRYFTIDQRLNRARAWLEGNPQPAVTAFIKQLRQEIHNPALRVDSVQGRLIDGKMATLWDNSISVRRRFDALAATISVVTGLALTAIEGDDLARHLQDLWDRLPAIEARPADIEGSWNRNRGR